MTDLAIDGLIRELTSEELALIAGGSFLSGLKHFLKDVDKSAIEGEVSGGIAGLATGPEGVPVGAALGGLGGAAVGALNFIGL